MITRFKMITLVRKFIFLIAASALRFIAIYPTHLQLLTLFPEDKIGNKVSMGRQTNQRIPGTSGTFSSLSNEGIPLEKRIQRQLPMFNDTGGMIVFIHIAKTGGSSIREGFRKLPNIAVKRVMNVDQLIAKKKKLDWFLSLSNDKSTINGGREKVLLLEIHGHHGEPMTMVQLHPFIQQWKHQAATNKKNFFVFTLFREPATFHVSYFTFFRHFNCQELWCDKPALPQTEEYLIQSMIPNQQCLYLARTYNKTINSYSTTTTSDMQSEYQTVLTLLKNDVDWIGTTDSLYETTLPLLTYMVAGNARIAQNFPIANKQNVYKKLQFNNISDIAIQHLRDKSKYDQQLYEMARRDYSLDMWSNFQPTTSLRERE